RHCQRASQHDLAPPPTTRGRWWSLHRHNHRSSDRNLSPQLEGNPETALGHVEEDRIVDAFGPVILSQLLPQTRRVHAHYELLPRVERRGFSQRVETD